MLHDQRFYVAVAFVLFFVFFGRKIWKVIASGLDNRAAQVRRDLDEAGALRREAEKMLEDATRSREAAIAEAKTLIENSRSEAAMIADSAQRKAEQVLQQRERLAHDRISASRRAAIHEVTEAATRAAVSAVRSLLSNDVAQNDELARGLVSQGVDALPKALKAPNGQTAKRH